MSTTTPKTQTLAIENRPKRWDAIVGQEIPIKILVNSLGLGDVKPAYLFSGKTGCGKTTAATVLAKRLVCENPQDGENPCNECKWCHGVDKGVCYDVKFVDGASERSVQFVREEIIPFIRSAPISGRKRVLIIDEAHLYKTDAISAFLTLLEKMPIEAPKSVVILCTTEGEAIDPAIRNRCLPLIFSPIPVEQIATVMAKHTGADPAALQLLAEQCDGSFRTVWSFIESWQYLGENLTEDLIMQMMGGISTAEREQLWAEISANRMDAALKRWRKWISAGANASTIGKLLTKDAVEFAATYPDLTDWVKTFTLLSGAQAIGSETAWLPALYTMAGLRLVPTEAKKLGPVSQPTTSTETAQVPNRDVPSIDGSHVERLAFLGS